MSGTPEEILARLRTWVDQPIGTPEQLAHVLARALEIDRDLAELAATSAHKAITDCRDEVRQILDGGEIPE